MVGQSKLKESIANEPHGFILLEGSKYSGRKTLLREVFPQAVWFDDCKIDTVRKMIEMSHSIYDSVFIMPDIDDMSLAAKNAILKLIEEPPNGNRFIMTIENVNNTLSTIISRAQIKKMQNYSQKELITFLEDSGKGSFIDEILSICTTPGEIEEYGKYDWSEFINTVDTAVTKLWSTSITNCFKLGNKIALKADSDGYDLQLFWRAYKIRAAKLIAETNDECEVNDLLNAIRLTQKYIDTLRVKSVNKAMLFGAWVVAIQGV